MYRFAPSKPQSGEHEPFVTWDGGFDRDEIWKIGKYCDKLEAKKAGIGGFDISEKYDHIRTSQTAWINQNPETQWFFDKMGFIARRLNSQFYRFDIDGFVEPFQFAIYKGEEKGHYDWHTDCSEQDESNRKLSLVLQLSDPKNYEGGELQVLLGAEANVVERKIGLVAAFPAFRVHRVSPVTKGLRRTIVCWASGPPFR